jgi:hypothetical protein
MTSATRSLSDPFQDHPCCCVRKGCCGVAGKGGGTRTRSPVRRQKCSFLNCETLSMPALVRVSAANTSPRLQANCDSVGHQVHFRSLFMNLDYYWRQAHS